MSVAKRKTSSGTTTEYHYDFSQDGKRYRGVCEGCTTERAALAYEKEKKEFVKKLASQKTATALVENFRQELTGSTTIPLNEAYALYESKPRPKLPGTSRAKQNRRIWEDFCAFMRSRYPEVLNLAEIHGIMPRNIFLKSAAMDVSARKKLFVPLQLRKSFPIVPQNIFLRQHRINISSSARVSSHG